MMLILGAPGTGKTSLLDELIALYRKAHPKARVVILDPNDQFRGIGGEWPPDGDVETWLRRLKAQRGKNSPPMLLVFDDADKFLSGGPPTGIFRDLFTSFRHWRVDIILNARRTQDIPKVVIASSSTVAIFVHRELYGRQYLAKNLGPDIAAEIPTERFHYVLVDVDEHETSTGQTKKRAQVVGADTR